MYSIELMIQEHENILKLLAAMQNACCGILNGREVHTGDFRSMIAFARNYADQHHHGKEEQILFQEMAGRLGPVGSNLVRHGMLVEHDLGRLHIKNLEAALNQYETAPAVIWKLNILAEAMGYVGLLRRHIDKENQVAYPYAEKNLPPEILRSIDRRVRLFEEEACIKNVQTIYLDSLHEICERYPDENRL